MYDKERKLDMVSPQTEQGTDGFLMWKGPFGRPRHRWGMIFQVDIREIS
jgi:hypothetical protein